ncbi:Xylose operon regulatory protein [Planctomycetes bacterium Pan216]|uniref:Xylose operon regulatory protein n=1 Tax=Kolteria novifilia TaxID=2527975 RepID=A0A518B932_9BACT|nr:Xylose operon regulatory protein [Planctomycetes bacterium Pan216]
MARKRRHVALIVETSITFGRGVLRGIAKFLKEQRGWSVFLEQRELGAALPDWIDRWDGDGIITRSDDPRILRHDLPIVCLFDRRESEPGFPMILNDSREVGRLAARHLLERGFDHLGYYGVCEDYWSTERWAGVREVLDGVGLEGESFLAESDEVRTSGWEAHQERLADWIAGRPLPFGLVAGNDIHGLRALDACRRRGLAVPEEVAVIGADNDEELCDLSEPPLSSVAFHPERVGYEAAKLLDRMMAGRRPPKRPLLIEPVGVVPRLSTDIIAIDDRDVARALRLIRRHACDGISVASILRDVPISRRSLEMKFERLLGRSPKREILRVRIERARTLLLETDLSITAISQQTGFHHPSRFGVVFREQTGLSPSAFRGSRRG